MGNLISQVLSSDYEDEPVQTNVTPLEFTPSERLRNMRLLALDPRSPSRFIDRTPIIVTRTPDQPSEDLMCPNSDTDVPHDDPAIPHDDPAIKDPRSPTTEFTRTPINPCHHSSAITRQRMLSTPQTFVEEPDSDVESVSMSPVILSNMKFSGGPVTSLESLESAIGSDRGSEAFSEKDASLQDAEMDSLPLDVDATEGDEYDEGYEDMEVRSRATVQKILHRVKSDEDVTPKLPAVIRSISYNRIGMKPKMLSLTPGVTRSPLSTVGNAPRVLLQRSILTGQAGKPKQERSVSLDKENILH